MNRGRTGNGMPGMQGIKEFGGKVVDGQAIWQQSVTDEAGERLLVSF